MTLRPQGGQRGGCFCLIPEDTRSVGGVDEIANIVLLSPDRGAFVALLDVSATEGTGADLLDVYVDWSVDGKCWLNGVHFKTVNGKAGHTCRYAIIGTTGDSKKTIDATTDLTKGKVRPGLILPYVRGRYTLVNDSGSASFTFSLAVSGR